MEEPTQSAPALGDSEDAVRRMGEVAPRREPVGSSADITSAPEGDGAAESAAWIEGALAYVPCVARRYMGCGLPFEELLAAGNLGLVEAAIRFDPKREVKFVTYADWWIRKSILTAIEEQSGPVRLPRYRQEQLRMVYDARANLRFRVGREPELFELAQATGLPQDDVEKLLGIGRQSISLEHPTGGVDGERPLHEVLAEAAGHGPQDLLLIQDNSGRLRRFVHALGLREKAVLTLRYGLGGAAPLTLREVGRRLAVSRERVRQIEHRALLQLRRMLQSG